MFMSLLFICKQELVLFFLFHVVSLFSQNTKINSMLCIQYRIRLQDISNQQCTHQKEQTRNSTNNSAYSLKVQIASARIAFK